MDFRLVKLYPVYSLLTTVPLAWLSLFLCTYFYLSQDKEVKR
jgi:hypothetical protein